MTNSLINCKELHDHRIASTQRVVVETAISRAVNVLLAAGMVLRYRSAYGNSYYLGWPGRNQLLRVSDHPKRARNRDGGEIIQSITITSGTNWSEDNFRRMVANALGYYLMKSGADGINNLDAENNEQ